MSKNTSEDTILYDVTIYLRSGASFVITSSRVKTKRDPATNELVGLEWQTPDSRIYQRLQYVRLDDISAIIAKEIAIEA